MSKQIKSMLMSEISSQLGEARDLLLVDCSKLDANSTNEWRTAMREKNIHVLSVRNKLARKVLNDLGVTGLDPFLEGASTLVWGGGDVVALSKEVASSVKKYNAIEIKGGAVEGSSLDPNGVTVLSKSPSRLELIGQISGLILSPGAQLAAALLGPGGKIAGQVQAISEKEGDS